MELHNIDRIKYCLTDMGGEEGLDYVIDFPAGGDLTILQLTDLQMQTMAGVRTEIRRKQVGGTFFTALPDNFELRAWRYVDEAVKKTQPDLIVLTGDNIYGELDDSGEMWLAFIRKMDSYQIPWCVVFGNHDNESGKGVLWQVEQLLKSEWCIFRRGNVAGNCNYNLVLRQGGEAKYLLYFLDSNGCRVRLRNPGEGMMPDNVDIDKIEQQEGFRDSQVTWMQDSAEKIRSVYGQVPVLAFFHTPPSEATDVANAIYGEAAKTFPFVPNREGDSGLSYEKMYGAPCGRFWEVAKEIGCAGIFVGHLHKVATSIVCDGIRMTFGVKTGTYDYHHEKALGSTLITCPRDGSAFRVENIYSTLPYKK